MDDDTIQKGCCAVIVIAVGLGAVPFVVSWICTGVLGIEPNPFLLILGILVYIAMIVFTLLSAAD